MRLVVSVLAALGVLLLCVTPSRACWAWRNATEETPIPHDNMFPVNQGGAGQGSLGFCFCDVHYGMPGGLYNTTEGYLCEYTDRALKTPRCQHVLSGAGALHGCSSAVLIVGLFLP